MSQQLVDRVRSVLTDTDFDWETIAPETAVIVRLCLGCRASVTNATVQKKLNALVQINQCLVPAMRGQWSKNIEDRFDRVEHPNRLSQAVTGKKQPDRHEAIADLISFYREVWYKFQIWERKVLPDSQAVRPSVEEALISDPEPNATDVGSRPTPKGSCNSVAPVEAAIAPSKDDSPFSTPLCKYQEMAYCIHGTPGTGKEDGCYWYCITNNKRTIQSQQSFPLVTAANWAARQAINTLVGKPISDSSVTEQKGGSRRRKQQEVSNTAVLR
jgi:hypothetical protein